MTYRHVTAIWRLLRNEKKDRFAMLPTMDFLLACGKQERSFFSKGGHPLDPAQNGIERAKPFHPSLIVVAVLSLMLLSCGRATEWRGPVDLRASASAEQTVLPGDLVTLTADDGFAGRNSSIQVTWTASTQNAEAVILHNANSLHASFTAPATIGTYIFHFQATNGDFWANASTKIHVQPIIVSAGSLQNVLPGDPVTLRGSYNTNDVTRRDLPIEWVAATENPAIVTLSGATTLSPTFVAPGVIGEYVFKLSVQNGTFVGQSRVTVNVTELVVNAGAAQTVLSGDTVRLVGTYTAGVVAPSLSIDWIAAAENPAAVTLSGATTLSSTFVAPNTPGTYTFDLKVTHKGIIRTAKTNVKVRTWTWTQVTASAPWSGRYEHTTAVFNNKLWVIGGAGWRGLENDVWSSSDGVNWIQATASAPWAGREEHTTAVFDNKLWVIGGDYKNDVWSSSDGVNWTQTTASAPWSGRVGHTTAVFNNKLWVIGGWHDWSFKNDVWSSSDGVNWTQATASAPWSGRYDHTTAVFNNKLWVIGGRGRDWSLKDVWSSSDGVNWTQATASAPWSGRYGHTTAVFNNKLWVIGGNSKNDVWSSSDGVNWTQATASAPWSARYDHATAVFNNKLWVIGGADGSRKNDVWFMELTE